KAVTVTAVARASIAFGLAMVLMALAPNRAVAFPIALVLGLASITFLTTSTAIVQLRAEPAMRGRVLALQAIVFLGSTPIGGPIVGWIAEHHGARWSLVVGALAALGAGLWGLRAAERPPVPLEPSGAKGEPADAGGELRLAS